MKPDHAPHHVIARPLAAVLEAAQCACTLAVILGVIGLIGCLAGIASLADLPWILAGVFMGSFVRAAFRGDAASARRR